MHLISAYLRTSLKRESEYKAAFYMFFVNQLVAAGIWVVFWFVLTQQLDSIGRWGVTELVLLAGFSTFSNGLWFLFSFVWRIPHVILSGELNVYLVRPVHAFFHYVGKNINLRGGSSIIYGVIIVAAALVYWSVPITTLSLTLAFTMAFFGFLVSYLPFALITLSAFWIGRAEFIRDLFIELFVFERYPLTEFPRTMLLTFTFVFPLAFSGTMSTLVLTTFSTTTTLWMLAVVVLLSILQFVLFRVLWRKGLRRYESYGG